MDDEGYGLKGNEMAGWGGEREREVPVGSQKWIGNGVQNISVGAGEVPCLVKLGGE